MSRTRGVTWADGGYEEIGRVVVCIIAARICAKDGCGVIGWPRRCRPFEEICAAVSDQVNDVCQLRRTARLSAGAVARNPGRRIRDDDLAGGGRHVDASGRVRRRKRAACCAAGEKRDEVILTGCKRAAQRDHTVGCKCAGACRAGVLDRISGQRYRGTASIEDLDEVVPEGGTGVPSTAIDLADDDVRRRGECGCGEHKCGNSRKGGSA